MLKITKLTRAKRNLIVEEVSKSYSNYKKYQNLATKYAIVNDRTKVFTSYNKIQQEIKKLLTELNGDYKVISLICRTEILLKDKEEIEWGDLERDLSKLKRGNLLEKHWSQLIVGYAYMEMNYILYHNMPGKFYI